MRTGSHRPRPVPVLLAALLTALLAVGLAGCMDANSLGDEPPTVVQVGSPPTWGNGIGELMRLKCGVCHVVPRSDLSPVDTPQDFDLNHHITSPLGVAGAQSIIGELMGAGNVLREEDPDSRMPPPFATPLVTSERNALEAWAVGGGL